MIDLKQYRINAEKHDMCNEYHDMWDKCHSNKQIMDMSLGVKAVDFLCDSIAKGWGLSPDYIYDRFENFINGRYVSKQNGYTSKMYCRYKGEINADTTMLVLINSDADITLPKNGMCEIYCTGKCEIGVSGEGRAAFVCYGNPVDIKIIGGENNTKRINKKERDRYDG